MSGSLTAEQLARAECLEHLARNRVASRAEVEELAHLRDLARSLTGPAEVADNPATPFVDEARRPLITGSDDPNTPEDESDYLGAQLSRSAREREAAAMLVLRTLGRLGGPLLLALLKAELTKGIEAAHVPPALAPFVSVVEAAALDAAGRVVKDVAG